MTQLLMKPINALGMFFLVFTVLELIDLLICYEMGIDRMKRHRLVIGLSLTITAGIYLIYL